MTNGAEQGLPGWQRQEGSPPQITPAPQNQDAAGSGANQNEEMVPKARFDEVYGQLKEKERLLSGGLDNVIKELRQFGDTEEEIMENLTALGFSGQQQGRPGTQEEEQPSFMPGSEEGENKEVLQYLRNLEARIGMQQKTIDKVLSARQQDEFRSELTGKLERHPALQGREDAVRVIFNGLKANNDSATLDDAVKMAEDIMSSPTAQYLQGKISAQSAGLEGIRGGSSSASIPPEPQSLEEAKVRAREAFAKMLQASQQE